MRQLDQQRIEKFHDVLRRSLEDPEEVRKKSERELARQAENEAICKSAIEKAFAVKDLFESKGMLIEENYIRRYSDWIPAGLVERHPGIKASLRLMVSKNMSQTSKEVTLSLLLESPQDSGVCYQDDNYIIFHNSGVNTIGDHGWRPLMPGCEEWPLVEECLEILEKYAEAAE